MGAGHEGLLDSRGRPLRDLRLSLTDLCNFRCLYCMPPEGEYKFFSREELLTADELVRLARIYIGLGVRRIRLTGGEPLLRPELPQIVRRLAELPGLEDLSMTSNGARLAAMAQELKQAGLRRVTVSLDAIEPEAFRRLSGGRGDVHQTLAGIAAAQAAGLGPVKINTVVRRGWNEDQILPLAHWAQREGVELRYIEFMDVGNRNHWDAAQVVTSREVLERLSTEFELEAQQSGFFGEVAERYAPRSGGAQIGFISSVSAPFCSSCTRSRVSADGKIYNCLFSGRGFDLRELLRNGAEDAALEKAMQGFWKVRTNRYSEERAQSQSSQKRRPIVEMFQIGG